MLRSEGISLFVKQQPLQALVTNDNKEKSMSTFQQICHAMLTCQIARKAVDPPPIVQLKVHDGYDGEQG